MYSYFYSIFIATCNESIFPDLIFAMTFSTGMTHCILSRHGIILGLDLKKNAKKAAKVLCENIRDLMFSLKKSTITTTTKELCLRCTGSKSVSH